MSEKNRREIELLVEALDDVDPTPEQIAETIASLPVTPEKWAAQVRARVAAAQEAARKARHGAYQTGYQQERARYEARKPEPALPLPELQLVFKNLVAEAPHEVRANFHKYIDAPPEELAEQIRALRHLLGKKDET